MLKPTISTLLTLLLFAACLSAQAKVDKKALLQCKQEAESIDKLALWKVYNRSPQGFLNRSATRMLLSEDVDSLGIADDSPSEYYYDSQNRLRKSIQRYFDSDYSHTIISYFNEDGYLCYMLDNMCDTEVETHVYLYAARGKVIFGDMYYRSIEKDNLTHKELTGESLPICLFEGYSCFFSAYHTDSLRLDHFIKEKLSPLKNIPLGAKQVRFSQLKAGDVCYVNANRVNMRSQPNTSSAIAYTVDAGEALKVTDVAASEKVGGQEHSWYKVNMDDWRVEGGRVGYVYGAYLTPGEQAVPAKESKPDAQKKASCKAIAEKVLSDTLRVGYVLISESKDTSKLARTEPDDPNFMTRANAFYTFYFDKQNRIRRLEQNRLADGVANDCYYDEQGKLRYVLIHEYGGSCLYGYMYADGGNAVELSISYRRYSDVPFTNRTFYNVPIPEEYIGFKFEFHTHTDSLKKVFGIENVPASFKQVCFTQPSVGDIVTVMVEKANICNAPSASAAVVDVTYATSHHIINAIVGEWYEVSINYRYSKEEKKYISDKGYIRAADFLLVEKELP